MKKISFLLAAALLSATTAFGGVGSIPDNGAHYNLNIIGVQKGKSVDMTGSDRHTILVPLNTSGTVDKSVKISYVPGPDFQVLDGNATATQRMPTAPPSRSPMSTARTTRRDSRIS